MRATVVQGLIAAFLLVGCKDSSSKNGSQPNTTGNATMGGSAAPINAGSSAVAANGGTQGGSGQSGGANAPSASGGSSSAASGGAGASGGGGTSGSDRAMSTGGSSAMMDAGAMADAGDEVMPDAGATTGTFPPITDPWQAGPFPTTSQQGAGPDRNATVFYPRNLGENGLKHPIVIWDNGNTVMGPSIYQPLLEHLASHGFAVYAAYVASDMGAEIKAGLDWMIAENDRDSSPYYHKLDVTKTAAMGHSQGSIATFAVAGDMRLTTTIHLSGGTNPDIAQGHETLANLHRPAAFICGDPNGGDGLIVGDVASEWCAYDFEHTMVPVFLAQITGASHITAPGMTQGACAAWLRWQLTGDTTMRAFFAGDDCTLCKRPSWVVKSRGL